MRLIDGAEAIKGDLPARLTIEVDAPIGAGDSLGTGVHRLSSIITVRDRLADALDGLDAGETPLVIGGDCGVELAAVTRAIRTEPDTCVLWFDAHGDLNTPDTSRSSAFGGMVLRSLLGDGEPLIAAAPAVDPSRVVLVGARALDDGEADYLAGGSLHSISAADVDATTVVDAIAATGATSVYLHLDLDVLDPAEIAGVGSGEPFGLSLETVLAVIGAVRARYPLSGGAILGFAPESLAAAVDDLPAILRILSAITSSR
ncbi:hypothetical protein L3i23_20510 [Herbiconiux sp. L3-i23]|nr:hypothetical protein L3i23_20510 [Herbiconiux sp. L3-i23]